jgi:tetratricopeptide (TPR) repeat protein
MQARAAEAVRLAETSADLLSHAYAFGLAAPAAAVVTPSDPREHARTRERIQGALELYRAAGRGEGWEMLLSMNFLVMASLWMGDIARAETDLARMIALSEDRGNRWAAGVALDLLGGIAWRRGEIARAQECYERYLQAMGPVGDTQSIAHAHYLIGRLAEEDGNLGSARVSYAHALALVREVGDFALIERGGAAIAIMAAVATQQPVPPQAMAHAAAAFGLSGVGEKPLMLEQVLTTALQGAEAMADVRS